MLVERCSDFLCWCDHEPAHWCPACGELHGFHVYSDTYSGQRWTYNNDPNCPTFSPAQRIVTPALRFGREPFVCHYELRDGKITYGSDCTHILAGETILLPKVPALFPPAYQVR